MTGKRFVYLFEMVILLSLSPSSLGRLQLGSYGMLNALLFPSMHSTPAGLQN